MPIAPAERKCLRDRRTQVVVLATVVITVLAALQAAGRFGREADTADGDSGRGRTWQEPAEPVTVGAPDGFSGYRLITAASAERDAIEARTAGKNAGQRWCYDKDGDGRVHALLLVSTIDTDPGLRRTKQSNSTDRQFRGFFASSKASDVTSFEPGAAGVELNCGRVEGPGGPQAVCAWSDDSTFGALRLADIADLSEAARTTAALRAATVH
ncbi:hypothetical protein [Streptomyces nojiriensis]|uniref:hypothetical protein n=1 Tax=Streptomyces nojiriensis TaxID=66374 RepID=UPI0036598984